MRNRSLAAVAFAAAVVAGCGADSKSCSTDPSGTRLAAGKAVADCAVAPGGTVTLPVRLCPSCSQSSPSCTAEFRDGEIEIDPLLRVCQEDAGCADDRACESDPSKNQTNCTVTIPSGTAPGSYPVLLSNGATRVATVNVGSTSGCSFAFASEPAPSP